MTALPPSSDFSTVPGNHANMRASLVGVQGYLAGLLGNDGTVATGLGTLGTLGSAYLAKTAAYTVVTADRGRVIEATTGTWTLALSAAATAGSGFSFILKNSGAGTITVDPSGAEQVNGAATLAVSAGQSVILSCTGTAWVAIVWVTSSAVTDGDKGDIIVSGSGTAWAVDYTAVNAVVAPVWSNITGTKVLTILDANLTIQDDGDATKQMRLQLSGIATGTLRTLTVPDINGTIILDSGTQSVGGVKTFTGLLTVDQSTLNICDATDATKKIKFILAGLTTGTQRNLTVPDAAGTLTLLAATQTLSSKTLDNTNAVTLTDANFTLQDDGDTSKQVIFQLAGLTTATTRTLTVPDVSGTIVVQGIAYTIAQSWTFSNSTNTFGNGTATGTTGLAVGATVNAATKTVNIGTSGVSGSTTNVAIGSAVAGALGTLTVNSPTTTFGTTATSVILGAADLFSKLPAPVVISGAATLTNANLQTTCINYTGAAGAVTFPLGSTLDSLFTTTDTGLEFSVVNTGSGAATMTANTGVTLLGVAAVAAGTSALWALRRTGASTYLAIRKAG